MRLKPLKRFLQVPGLVLSLTLIGVFLLNALLYYRAIKIQRFIEPALAISTPRFLFAKNVDFLLVKEFGADQRTEVRFTANTIFVKQSLLVSGTSGARSEPAALKKLGQVFLSVLGNPKMSDYVDSILIRVPYPAGPDTRLNEAKRREMQHRAEFILQSLFSASPELAKKYGTYFSATALPLNDSGTDTAWVEFRVIPSEMVHIEALRSLMKYAR